MRYLLSAAREILGTFRRLIPHSRSTFRDLGYLYANNAIGTLAGLITVVCLANLISPNEYGNYKYIYSLVGMISLFSLSGGFRTLTLQSAAKRLDGVLTVLHKKNILLNLPMCAVGILTGVYYLLKGNVVLGVGIMVATTASIVANNGIIVGAYLNGRKLYHSLLVTQTIVSVSNMTAVVLAAFLFRSVLPIVITLSITISVVSLGLYYVVRWRYLRNRSVDENLFRYGRHLNALSIANTILQHIDSILIFKFLGSHHLALYAIATPFVDRIIGFLKASYFFALPKFTEIGPHAAKKMLYQRSLVALLVGVLVLLLYIVLSPPLFSILFPRYEESLQLSWLFALNIPLVAFSILPLAYLDSLIEAKNKYILNGLSFVVRIVTLLPLVLLFGIPGVIWSELITRMVGLSIVFFLIERHTRLCLRP